MQVDPQGNPIASEGPADHVALVSPNDSTDLPGGPTRAIYIGATVGNETVTIPSGALAVGVPHPIRAVRIWSTGTTAAPIVAVW
jgi:hypothetical protein